MLLQFLVLTDPKVSSGTDFDMQQILYHVLYIYISICITDLDKPAPVTISHGNDIIEQKQGTPFSVICFTYNFGYPEGRLNWFKNNCTHGITTEVVRRGLFSVGLSFTNLTVQDMGTYKCQITNDLGRQEKSFQLVVSGMSFNFYLCSSVSPLILDLQSLSILFFDLVCIWYDKIYSLIKAKNGFEIMENEQ